MAAAVHVARHIDFVVLAAQVCVGRGVGKTVGNITVDDILFARRQAFQETLASVASERIVVARNITGSDHAKISAVGDSYYFVAWGRFQCFGRLQ